MFTTISVQHTKIANTTFLLYAGGILMSAFIGFVIFRERVDRRAGLALACAVVGLVVYNGPTLSVGLATLTGVLGGFCISFTGTFRKLLMHQPRLIVVWASFGYAASASLVIFAFWHDDAYSEFHLNAYIAALLFGILIVTQSQLVTFGYSHLNLSSGAVILSTEVAFGALYGWIGYSEVPSASEIIGATFILLGAIGMAFRKQAPMLLEEPELAPPEPSDGVVARGATPR